MKHCTYRNVQHRTLRPLTTQVCPKSHTNREKEEDIDMFGKEVTCELPGRKLVILK